MRRPDAHCPDDRFEFGPGIRSGREPFRRALLRQVGIGGYLLQTPVHCCGAVAEQGRRPKPDHHVSDPRATGGAINEHHDGQP